MIKIHKYILVTYIVLNCTTYQTSREEIVSTSLSKRHEDLFLLIYLVNI